MELTVTNFKENTNLFNTVLSLYGHQARAPKKLPHKGPT